MTRVVALEPDGDGEEIFGGAVRMLEVPVLLRR